MDLPSFSGPEVHRRMAKAQFHKNQRVYVRPVGTWAVIERIVPQWVKDMDEPLRIHYDVGLGREFAARELETEEVSALSHLDPEMEDWHVVRVPNKWRSAEECAGHPVPGTHPVVVTGSHDMTPDRVELQAKVIAAAPKFMVLLQRVAEYARTNGENLPDEMMTVAGDADALLSSILNPGA